MGKYLKKLERLSAKIAFKAAKTAAGNASLWGFCQPKEPSFEKNKVKGRGQYNAPRGPRNIYGAKSQTL